MTTFVCFAEKGPDARVGGYVRADSDAERDELTVHFKSFDLKVTWTNAKGEKL